MIRKLILPLFALLLVACSGDDNLTPSANNQLIDFPQGNADYDQTILDIYNRYGTQILYRYNDDMFRWQITTKLDYHTEPADPAYIADALRFMQRNCFDFYTADSLRLMLPYRIYLAGNLLCPFKYYGTDASGQYVDISYTRQNLAATNGYRNVCFGLANSRLRTMSADSLRISRGELNAAIIAHCVEQGIMEVPKAFADLEYQGVNWANHTASGGFNSYGLIEYLDAKQFKVEQDFAVYMKYLMAYPRERFEQMFGGTFDVSGRIVRKAQILRQYMLSAYGIDVEAIASKEPVL